MLRERLEQVRTRIRQACQRCGRDPSSITLVAVTKTVPCETIQEAVALGVTALGENRVQEAQAKREKLDPWLRPQGSPAHRLRAPGRAGLWATALSPEPSAQSGRRVRWHLIGHLQSNKARHAVELFDVIHSVDSLVLVGELERQAAKRSRSLDLLIQVNVSGEPTKSGCRPEEAAAMADAIKATLHLQLIGLMTIPPYTDDPQASRRHFRHLRELRDTLGPTLKLSMGMSSDFEVAIEEGADFVRIGTALFGAHRR